MARRDLPNLIIRAKKMAGALGRVPSEGDLIASFDKKGVKINMEVARQIITEVRKFRKEKESGGTTRTRTKASASAKVETVEPEVRVKPPAREEVRAYNVPQPAPKRTTSYGPRR